MNELWKHLSFLLRRNEAVSIPGFGTMYVVDIPSFIDDKGEIIIPSKIEVIFEENNNDNIDEFILINSYCKKNRINENEARKLIDQTVRELRESIRRNGMVFAGRIGQFYLRNNSIEFKGNSTISVCNPYFIFSESGEIAGRNISATKLKKGVWSSKIKSLAMSGFVVSMAKICTFIFA